MTYILQHAVVCWVTTSSYCYGPIVQGRLPTHHSGGDHGGVEGLQQGFPSPAGCRKELLDPPNLTAVACSMFHKKEIRPLGFSRRGELIGERASSEVGPADLTTGRRGQGLGPTPWWWAWLAAPLRIIFGLCEASVKIGGLAFVLSNSENISCVTFWNTKTAENRELALWHLVNRLVPENA
jgi:hypothetical protein